uniref:Uncharacterized protein MANES_06G143900 n=1 Tax=Rhizophora mucronata TaxID=61149 RepID=A0A2P2LSV9_RHIMU
MGSDKQLDLELLSKVTYSNWYLPQQARPIPHADVYTHNCSYTMMHTNDDVMHLYSHACNKSSRETKPYMWSTGYNRIVYCVQDLPSTDAAQIARNLSNLGQIYNKEDMSTDVLVSAFSNLSYITK